MANEEHLAILKQGEDIWNQWREENPETSPDLSNVDLRQFDLRGVSLLGANLCGSNLVGMNLVRKHLEKADLVMANLSDAHLYMASLTGAHLFRAGLNRAHLTEAILSRANLNEADLVGAELDGARLDEAHLIRANLAGAHLLKANLIRARLAGADLSGAQLREADLYGANLDGANLTGADLSKARLIRASLVETQFERANLQDCRIYGVSVWNIKLSGASQLNLIVTPENEPAITVDNLEVAQFIYLLLNNEKIRDVIDTITSKVVLILGRFTPERKAVLDALREELRKRNYTPVLFDFDKPASRDITETVRILASMSRFVIADLTEPRSLPHELMSFVEHYPSVAVQPILLSSEREYGMYKHFTRYCWVLPIQYYDDQASLLASLSDKVIAPAEAKANELQKR